MTGAQLYVNGFSKDHLEVEMCNIRVGVWLPVIFKSRLEFFPKAKEHQGTATRISSPISILRIFYELNSHKKVSGNHMIIYEAIFKLVLRSKAT